MLERYLVFSQFFLLVFVAVAWAATPGRLARGALLAGVIGLVAPAAYSGVTASSDHQEVLTESAAYLNREYLPGDLVVLARPAEMNRVLYYLTRQGLRSAAVCCVAADAADGGHVCHLASVRADERVSGGGALASRRPTRIWLNYDYYLLGQGVPPGYTVTRSRTLRGRDGTQVRLELLERQTPNPGPPAATRFNGAGG